MKKILTLLLLVVILVGCSDVNTVEIDGQVRTLEDLQFDVHAKQVELTKMEDEMERIERESGNLSEAFKSREEEFERLSELAEEEDEVRIAVRDAKEELDKIERQIASAQTELDQLQGQIVELSDEPIKVGAGYFYFGQDIAPGRYMMKPQAGRSGNVFLRRDGSSYVNTILGSRDSHVEDYVFDSRAGDELDTRIPIELYPVE